MKLRLPNILCPQDASIKAFRPEEEVVGGGAAAVNGHMPGALALAREAVPDVCSATEDAHCGAVHALALCGSYVCSAGGDAMIRIWDASTLVLFRCGAFPLLFPYSFWVFLFRSLMPVDKFDQFLF